MTRAAFVLVALAACSDPPFTLRFRVTPGQASACFNSNMQQITSCSDVTMLCRAVVSIRIFNPADTTSPYISVCKELSGQPNLCSIAGVDLPKPAKPVPEQTLAVEMVVYPFSAVTKDPDTGELQCPTGVKFDSTGFPIASVEPCLDNPDTCPPVPAIGGITYYHPGDTETVVDLGCTDIGQLNDVACIGQAQSNVHATVDDFDTEVSVQPSLADRLAVAIGSPVAKTFGTDTHYELNTSEAHALARTVIQPVPGWGGSVPSLSGTACLDVLEDGAQTTATLTCKTLSDKPGIGVDITGTRLSKPTLLNILGALGLAQFPDQGLVVGIVLDHAGLPVPNLVVTPTNGSIKYLSHDLKTVGGTVTSTSGAFVSQDAAFNTTFTSLSGLDSAMNIGGLVDGKVTIVVLQFQTPLGG